MVDWLLWMSWSVDWLTDLIDWLIGLIDWLVDYRIEWFDWVTDWLIGWLVDLNELNDFRWAGCLFVLFVANYILGFAWLIDWFDRMVWLIGYYFICFIDGLVEWQIDWLVGWLVDWLIDWLIDWSTDGLIDWLSDLTVWWIDWVNWLIISIKQILKYN